MTRSLAPFRRPAILGSSEMAALLAARFADAGIAVSLYDKITSDANPNHLAERTIQRLRQITPLPCIDQEVIRQIRPCNYRDHWANLAEHDVIIECGADYVPQKQALLSRIAPALNASAVLLTTGGGISISELSQALPAGMRPRFLGAHFFKPLMWRNVLELIPTYRSEPRVIERCQQFFTHSLALTGIVVPDSPNYAAIRYFMLLLGSMFELAKAHQLPLAEVVVLVGLATGKLEKGLLAYLQEVDEGRLAMFHAQMPEAERLDWSEFVGFIKPIWRKDTAFLAALTQAQAQMTGKVAQDWQNLRQSHCARASFFKAYLEAIWAHFDCLSEQLRIMPEALNTLIALAFEWSLPPLLSRERWQAGAMSIEAQLDNKENKHSVFNKTSAKTAQKIGIKPNKKTDSLYGQSLEENAFASIFYQEKQLVIWKPQQCFTLEEASIASLRRSLEYAGVYDVPLALFCADEFDHKSVLEYWQQREESEFVAWLEALADLIMAFRMYAKPIVAVVGGQISDLPIALLLQVDQLIADADLRVRLSSIEEELPLVGGLMLEWLRRLPPLNAQHRFGQIQTIFGVLPELAVGVSSHRLRELGVIRSQDRVLMCRGEKEKWEMLQSITPQLQSMSRAPRFVQMGLSAEEIAKLRHSVADNWFNRALINGLSAHHFAPHPLSLKETLKGEISALVLALKEREEMPQLRMMRHYLAQPYVK